MKKTCVWLLPLALASWSAALEAATPTPRGVMLMNRIGPSTIDLFIANADGRG